MMGDRRLHLPFELLHHYRLGVQILIQIHLRPESFVELPPLEQYVPVLQRLYLYMITLTKSPLLIWGYWFQDL